MPQIPNNDLRPGLKPPQIGLSTLLLLVAVLCSIFATLATLGPYVAFSLVLFFLAILAHISGNALGTRLRECGDQPIDRDGTPIERRAANRELDDADYAPATRLSGRQSLGIMVVAVTVLGALLGATVGGSLLIVGNWQRINSSSVAFALLFSSVLGAFGGFLTSSFIYVLMSAHRQALHHTKRQ